MFATNGDIIAFSNDKTLSIAKDDKIFQSESSLSSKAKDIVIFGDHIVVLNNQNKLEVFRFADDKLSKDDSFFDTIQLEYKHIDTIQGIFATANNFYVADSSSIIAFSKTESPVIPCLFPAGTVISDFAIIKNNVFILSSKKLYKLSYKTTNLDDCLVASNYQFSSLDSGDNVIYLNTDSQIVQYNPAENTFFEMGKTPFAQGKINFVGGDTPYIFVDCKADLSIKQFSIVNNKIKYINSFDNTIYQAPEVFNIVRIAKASENIDVFVSPKTLLPVMQATKDSYLVVLAEKEEYYYVTNGTGKYGYIAKDSPINIIDQATDTKWGTDVCVLHPNTPLYSLPFESSTVVAKMSINDRLVLINCLAVQDGVDVWGWCKVSYVGENDQVITAYVQNTSIAPYTSLTPPNLKKSAKVKLDKFGTLLNVYALPADDSKVVNQLVDGTEIKLLEKLDTKSEWTMIMIGDQVGYVKTANILTSGLTSVQIFIATIVPIVVVATIIIVTILLIKRRQNQY